MGAVSVFAAMVSLLLLLFPLVLCSPPVAPAAPSGPQGPPGAQLRHDLLKDSFPGANMGAFKSVWAEPCSSSGNYNTSCNHNHELQTYLPEKATQASNGEITLKAEKHSNGWITSAKVETLGIWTTSTDSRVKDRGYIEVRATLPAKVDGWQYKGSWPAIWMLGVGSWPSHGELDIVEMVNGKPKIWMTTHSSSHHGGNGQHPNGGGSMDMNANFAENELIAGFEWNLLNHNQIDLTWWMTYYDLSSHSWVSAKPRTLSIQSGHGQDYHEFLNSFHNNGFYLIINLAQGGDMPQTNDVFVNGQPQYVVVKSAKVYGF